MKLGTSSIYPVITTMSTTPRTSSEHVTSSVCNNFSILFHVIMVAKCVPSILELNWKGMTMKCTKMKDTRAGRAKLQFFIVKYANL